MRNIFVTLLAGAFLSTPVNAADLDYNEQAIIDWVDQHGLESIDLLERIVNNILVPVSPSGTGNTFKASTSDELFSSHDVAVESISRNSLPFIISTCFIYYLPYR